MKVVFSGGCLCGAVHYESTGEPAIAGHCYCEDCRRTSGTGHSSVLAVPKDTFRVNGETRAYRKDADSGNTVTRNFCPNCGSLIFASNSGFPDMSFLKAGTLDDPEIFKPQFIVFASRAASWDGLDDTLTAFAEMPPKQDMPEEVTS